MRPLLLHRTRGVLRFRAATRNVRCSARTSERTDAVHHWKGLLIGILALTACSEPPGPALRVGDLTWSEGELLGLSQDRKRQLAELAALAMSVADGTTLEALERVLQLDLDAAWIGQAALEARLDDMGAGEAQLRTHYETDPQYELTVRHILFFSERTESEAERAAARQKAEDALERLRNGEPFPQIAAELSEEPGAEGREGLLTPGREGSWVPEFWNAALSLDVGEISPVTETQYGFHVLRLEDREVVPFEEARPQVVREVALMGVSLDQVRSDWLLALEDEITRFPEAIDAFVDSGLPQREILAQWPEGTLDDEEFFQYLAEDPEAEERVAEGDLDSVTEIVREVARLRMAMDRATAMGVELPASVEAEIYREWDDRVYRWTSALGFVPELTSAQIKEAAEDALARTGQAADIARREYRPFGSILLEFYGVSWGETDD